MMKTLLAVLAHPDDESFGPGGTLALYARRGASVHLICATRGDVGDVDPDLLQGHESVAELREAELRCAVEELGLTGLHLLDYRDSGMQGTPDNLHPDALAAAPLDEVAMKIARLIRELKPQVLMTSDPQGGYGHPDHIAVSKATSRAFELAADLSVAIDGLPAFQAQKLYFYTFPSRRLRWLVRLLPLIGVNPRRWGRNHDIDLVEITQISFPIHAKIVIDEVSQVKARASACHVSQQESGPPNVGLIGRAFALLTRGEYFMRAIPAAPESLRERDLFEGVA